MSASSFSSRRRSSSIRCAVLARFSRISRQPPSLLGSHSWVYLLFEITLEFFSLELLPTDLLFVQIRLQRLHAVQKSTVALQTALRWTGVS